MKSITVCLLADQSIWVGELSHRENLCHRFHTESTSELDRFLIQNQEESAHLCSAFGYWVLCALGRAKEDKNKYGNLTRKICEYSRKLWNLLRNQAKKIALQIKTFQKNTFIKW